MSDEPMNLDSLARAKGTTRWILHRLATRRRIPSVTVDGQIRVKPSDYDAYVAENGKQR
jgi:hypothetical protein